VAGTVGNTGNATRSLTVVNVIISTHKVARLPEHEIVLTKALIQLTIGKNRFCRRAA
jgi:hypothetical protein